MTIFAKYFYGFNPSTSPAISFANRGDRDNLLRDKQPGDLIVFIGTGSDETETTEQRKLLGVAEIGDTAVNTEDLVDLSARPESHFRDGKYRWPFAIPMTRAWKFEQPPDLDFLRDGVRRDARIRAVSISPDDAARLRNQLRWVEVPIPGVSNGATTAPNHHQDASETDWSWLPTAEAFAAHWRARGPTDAQRKMLVTHYWSPNPDMDPRYMADVMGWDSAGAANLHYGTFARNTAEAMKCVYPDPDQYDKISLFTKIVGPRREVRWRMHEQIRSAIVALEWHQDGGPASMPGDVEVSLFKEGELLSRVVTYRSRSASIRQLCLDHYGAKCSGCDFEPAHHLGPDFANLIDVHHLDPIAASVPGRETDPVVDCRPLCPTCHRLAHHGLPRGQCRSVDQLRELRHAAPNR